MVVFYKISQIIWKDKKYDSVINIMGGFHILLVKLKRSTSCLVYNNGSKNLRAWYIRLLKESIIQGLYININNIYLDLI